MSCKVHFIAEHLEMWEPSDGQKQRLETLLIPWAEGQPKSKRLDQIQALADGELSMRTIDRCRKGEFVRVKSAEVIARVLGESLEALGVEYRVSTKHERGDGRQSADISNRVRDQWREAADMTMADLKPNARTIRMLASNVGKILDGKFDEASISDIRRVAAYRRALKLSRKLMQQFPQIKALLGEQYSNYGSKDFWNELCNNPLLELEVMDITLSQVRRARSLAHADSEEELRQADREAANGWARTHIRTNVATDSSSPHVDGRQFDPAMA